MKIGLYLITTLLGIFSLPYFEVIENRNSPYSEFDDSNNITILSINVWGLPIWLPRMDQQNRYDKIASSVLQLSPDIICVQEAFAKSFRKKFLPKIPKSYYTSSDYTCNTNIVWPIQKDCYGGLMTFSIYPVLSETFYQYPVWPGMRIEEKMGKKGFLVTTIAIEDRVVNILNTHLYAGNKAKDELFRMKQITYMDSILNSLTSFQQNESFLVGDLNISHPQVSELYCADYSSVYNFIQNNMGFKDPVNTLSKNDFTIDHNKNRYTPSSGALEKLDYCLYRSIFSPTFVWESSKTLFQGQEAISDHLGWMSVFTLSTPFESSVQSSAFDPHRKEGYQSQKNVVSND